MIAQNQLEATHPSGRILLAPYDETHLAPVVPVDPKVLDYQPASLLSRYSSSDPQVLIDFEESMPHVDTWGIFASETATIAATPEAFLGAISLSERTLSFEDSDSEGILAHEFSAMLFTQRALGRGFGTLALLATTAHAFANKGAHMLYARTSPDNIPAQKTLAKNGFVQLEPVKEVKLINGTAPALQCWWLLSTEILAGIQGSAVYEDLARGREIYEAAAADLSLAETLPQVSA